jgi:CHAT domain-containing protein
MRKLYVAIAQFLLALLLVVAVVPNSSLGKIPNPIAVTIAPTPNSAEQLAEQAATLYQQGRYTAAIPIWQQAVDAYKARGDRLNQAMALSNLSLSYQQQGEWQQAKTTIATSLEILQSHSDEDRVRLQLLAGALDIQGRWQLATGQAEAALTTWQQTSKIYRQIGDRPRELQSQINQAQTLQELGFYRQAARILEPLEATLASQPHHIKAVGWLTLGNIWRLTGNFDRAELALQQSLVAAKELSSPAETSAALLALGNTARDLEDDETALDYYQQVAAFPTSISTIQAQIARLGLLLKLEKWAEARQLSTQIQPQLATLHPSRAAIAARILFAKHLMKLGKPNPPTSLPYEDRGESVGEGAIAPSNPGILEIARMLSAAGQQAKSLGDRRMEAYALGTLGSVYEQTQQLSISQDLTQQALVISQSINAPDLAYQWHWQLGRSLKAQGKIPEAIAAYREAWKALQSLRGDLVAVNPDVQFSFRESAEPVYRELIALLLSQISPQSVIPLENLASARDVLESLQQAELENFLRQACLEGIEPLDRIVDRQDRTAAIIYPIILADRLEVLVKLPQQPLRRYTTAIAQPELEQTVNLFWENLQAKYDLPATQSYAQTLYNWLLRPIEPALSASNVKTIVFVLDGVWRRIPMAALYDGREYLIQKYQIALTLGLQIFNPKPLKESKLQVLAAGVSESRFDFPPLPNVKTELKDIQSTLESRILLNESFTSSALQTEIDALPFPIVHLATHGQFSANPNDTFIIAWDKRIKVNELDSYLRARSQNRAEAIELLVFSACETAEEEGPAVLGIAGMAVRAGARSTVGSLWKADARSTPVLMSRFYQELSDRQLTKADALRRAQLAILQDPNFQHPYHWATFVLVGNWL